MDVRYQLTKERLEQFDILQLRNILNNIDRMCVDTYNYDETNQTYCPIALALDLHNIIKNPTDEIIGEEIGKIFQPVNILKGISGDFYTINRKEDMKELVETIILEKMPI
jgi:hypothetical protein